MSNVRVLPTPGTIKPALALPNIDFVEARWYRRGPRRSRPLWLVIHATHGAEGHGKARAGALEMQRIPPKAQGGKPRSAHLLIDTDSVVQCVPFECEAYHAGPHANQYGEGFEVCGSADQKRAQWLDELSLPMLSLAAHVLRWRSEVLMVPLVYRGPSDLVRKIPGVTTHAAVAQAFPGDTDHYDPGPHFPLVELLDAARALPTGAPPSTPNPQP
jgi:hypothetical protein